MATALHPHFKLGVVGYLSSDNLKEHVRRRVVREVTNMVDDEGEIGDSEVRQEAEDDLFMYMKGDDRQSVATSTRLQENVEKVYDKWNKVRVRNTTLFRPSGLHRNAWSNLFLRYNSPLPSSAAVERLFSLGSDILRPKRSSLTAGNFKKLVFLKGNMHMLERK